MDGPDARTGEDCVDRLRDHGQINRHPIALVDLAVAQDVGKPADLVVQLLVRDVLRLRGIVALPDDSGLVRAFRKVPVYAVIGCIQDAVLEPFDRDLARVEGAVLDPGWGLVPVEALGLLGPKSIRVAERAGIHLLVLGRIDIGALFPFRRDVVDFFGNLGFKHCRLQAACASFRGGRALCVPQPHYAMQVARAKASQAATLVAGRNSVSFAKLRGNNTWRCAPIDIFATDSKVRRASGLASRVCRRARSSSYSYKPPIVQTMPHSLSVTGCTESREYLTRAISFRRGSALIAARLIGFGSGFTLRTSTATNMPFGSVGSE